MEIYDMSRFVKTDSDRDVIAAIVELDINMTKDMIQKILYMNDALEHEAIDSLHGDFHSIQTVIGYNMLTKVTIGNKLIIRYKSIR